MSMYRYGGALTEVGDVKLKKFGQLIEFNDELEKIVVLGGGVIVRADHPAWKAFTDQELSIYANPLSHSQANAAFLAKKKTLHLAYAARRAELEKAVEQQQNLDAAKAEEEKLIAAAEIAEPADPEPQPDSTPAPALAEPKN